VSPRVQKSYSDLDSGFNRPEVLLKQLKEENPKSNLNIDKVTEALEGVDAYTLNKPVQRNFQRLKVRVSGIDNQWQADLADMTRLSKDNDGYKFILTVIDVFSKTAWAIPLKNKTGVVVAEALEKIFKHSKRSPKKFQTDDGTEFFNKTVQALFDKYEIHHFSTNNETKASIVERFNRTLKERMYRYFESVQSFSYMSLIAGSKTETVLDKLLDNYNNSYHSSIKMKPSEVNKKNEADVFHNLYVDDTFPDVKAPKLKVGDWVRISKARHVFAKGYEGNWTIEVFRVTDVEDTQPPVYKIKDRMDEPLEGRFYEQELQRITKPKSFGIEKILKTRKNGTRNEVFVQWLGYPTKFNSWIPASHVEDT
jgi:transposase InsO family protein